MRTKFITSQADAVTYSIDELKSKPGVYRGTEPGCQHLCVISQDGHLFCVNVSCGTIHPEGHKSAWGRTYYTPCGKLTLTFEN